MVYFIWLVEPDWKQLLEFNNLCIVGQILSQVNKTNTQGEIKLFIFDIEAVIQCFNIVGQAEQVISDWEGHLKQEQAATVSTIWARLPANFTLILMLF